MLQAKRIVQDALPGHVVDTLMQQSPEQHSPERALLQAVDLATGLASCPPAREVDQGQQQESHQSQSQQDQPAHVFDEQAMPTGAFSAFSMPGQGYRERKNPGSPYSDSDSGMPMLCRVGSDLRFTRAGSISGPSQLSNVSAACPHVRSPPQSPTLSRAPSAGAESAQTEVTAFLRKAALPRRSSFRAPTQAPAMPIESRRFSLDVKMVAAAPAGEAGEESESGSVVLPLRRPSMTWQGPRAQASNIRVSCLEGMLAEEHQDACVLFAGETSVDRS